MYDEQGNLTRQGAEQAIREGGSVVLPVTITEANGTVRTAKKLFSKVEDLPDDATFAGSNPGAQADARVKLEKQIADAQSQLARMGTKSTPAKVPGMTEVTGTTAKGKAGPNA